jgi:hypothetical protein
MTMAGAEGGAGAVGKAAVSVRSGEGGWSMKRIAVAMCIAALLVLGTGAARAQESDTAHVYVLSWHGYTVWVDGRFVPLQRSDCDPVFRSPDLCIVGLAPGFHKFATRGNGHYWDWTATLEARQTYMLVSPGDWSWSLGIYHVVPGGPDFSADLADADPDGVTYVGPGYLKGPWPPQWRRDSVQAVWSVVMPDGTRTGAFASQAECLTTAADEMHLYGNRWCKMFTRP